MSFMVPPTGTTIRTNASGSGVQLELDFDYQDTPPKVDEFLKKVGWSEHYSNHPNTQETLYQKIGDEDTQGMYFTWVEAMAYEWYRTITLGGL